MAKTSKFQWRDLVNLTGGGGVEEKSCCPCIAANKGLKTQSEQASIQRFRELLVGLQEKLHDLWGIQ